MSEEQQVAELEGLAAGADDGAAGDYIPGGEASPPPEDQGPTTAEMMAQLLSLSFALVAVRRGDHWRLTQAEAEQAGEAYGAVLDKYFPDMSTGPEITAIVVTGMIFTPRMMAEKMAAEQAQAEQEKGGESGDQSE